MLAIKLKDEITPRLGDEDCSGTTGCEQHRASPETPILGPTDRAPEVEVLWLTNVVFFHAQATFVHKVGGAHENIVDNFVHIKGRSVIDTIPLMDSAAFILGTFACNRVPVSPSNF